MKQKTKRVVSFRAAVERVFWRAKKRSLSARSSLSSLVGKKNNSLSNSLEEKSIIFSTRASFFVSDSREKKKMFSSAQARSTMIGSSSSVRSTRSSSKVRSTTVRVRAMKGTRVIFFLLPFFLKKMCVGFWRERARGPRCSERVNMIVDRRDASTIKREMIVMTFPHLFSRSRSLPIFIFTFDDDERKKSDFVRERRRLFSSATDREKRLD